MEGAPPCAPFAQEGEKELFGAQGIATKGRDGADVTAPSSVFHYKVPAAAFARSIAL